MKAEPLTFPELPEKILAEMARRPDAPATPRMLLESLRGDAEFGGQLVLDDITQALRRLLEAGLVFDRPNPLAGVIQWKLTQRGKLHQGLS